MFDLDYIKHLYDKYSGELIKLKPLFKIYYQKIGFCQFDDIESEILYMCIRERKPNHVIEFSPSYGWSTSTILTALNRNNFGELVSYDIHNRCVNKLDEIGIDSYRWSFILDDVRNQYSKFDLSSIDFIFIDCVHTSEFARQYIKEVLIPAKESGNNVWCAIHDVFVDNLTEGIEVRKFLSSNNIPHISAAPSQQRQEINNIREKEGLGVFSIHSSQKDPAVFFKLNNEI